MVSRELLVVAVLILLNGFFAMSELALVSARKARLQAMAGEGQRGAAAALQLMENSGRFLSTVQIGITLIGIFAGAFSGATLARQLGDFLATLPGLTAFSDSLALGLVVASITYLSLIVGELVPKQLALQHAERIAVLVARPMHLLARLAAPLVSLLDASTRFGLRLLGSQAIPRQTVSEEEIKTLLAEAARAGVVEYAEQALITGVMRLADYPVQAIMTPRPDIVWFDIEEDPEQIKRKLRESGYSRFLVGNGSLDEVLGVVQAKALLHRALDCQPLDLKDMLSQVPVVPEGIGTLQTLDLLKQSPIHMTLVVDEYGILQGLVTLSDILKSIIGDLVQPGADSEPKIVQRADGSWLLDGGLATAQVKRLLKRCELPGEKTFHTVAGFALSQLGHMPTVGEHFVWEDYRFEIVDMDGPRIDKVLVSQADSAVEDNRAV